jgi:nicotinamide-nucleotide amidase
MRAALLSIGSELMDGFLTDTNATFLTQELSALGIETVGVFQVGDSLPRVVRAFQRALEDADLVVASGGIGPTDDDLTREAVAAVVGEEPTVDEALIAEIRAFFGARGITMPAQNVKQAWVIPSSETLPNPMGTAPGWFVRHEGKAIVCMPGVPREMRRMWTEQATPRVLASLSGASIVSRTLKTLGIGESAAEQEVLDLVRRADPIVATYAKDDGVHIRVTAIRPDKNAAERAVAETERVIRERIGTYVYGYLDESLASAILAPIAASGDRVAIWEAGTSARFSSLLFDEADAAAVANARCTTYADAMWEVGVEDNPLAVASAAAAAVAQQAGARYGASIAVRIDAADDANADRAEGVLALALLHPGGIATREHRVRAITPEIRRRATLWACDFFWSTLRDAKAAHPE